MMKLRLAMMAGLIAGLFAQSASATLVRQVNLEELSEQADVIVKATVLDKQVEDDQEESGRLVTYYTLEVKDWIKGTSATGDNTLVIKQIAQGEYTSPDGIVTRQNLYFPEYQVGKTYVLFLPKAHPQTGLLAPLALGQGVFEVKSDGDTDTIPQLQQRAKMLGINLRSANPKLTRLLQTAKTQPSNTYQTFKSMIQAAGVSE